MSGSEKKGDTRKSSNWAFSLGKHFSCFKQVEGSNGGGGGRCTGVGQRGEESGEGRETLSPVLGREKGHSKKDTASRVLSAPLSSVRGSK